MKLGKRIACIILSICLLTSIIPSQIFAQGPEELSYPEKYDIFPTPHNMIYGDDGVTLNDVNIVITENADNPTKANIEETLNKNGIKYSYSDTLSDSKTNIVLGIVDDSVTITEYFNALSLSDTQALIMLEGYVLSVKDGDIYVMGSKAVALYYGVLTLNQMINTNTNVRDVLINDYSSSKNRGTVEGFYGIPWSLEARKSIINLMGDYKMNMYVYAPKDDPYHFGEDWNVPYPEKELAEMEELVQTSIDNNVEFVYTLHVGTHMDLTDEDDEINATLPEITNTQWDVRGTDGDRGLSVPAGQHAIDKYSADETWDSFIEKFEQMYSIGVRRFGILADDISFPVARYSIPYLINFINDVQDYFMTKYDDIESIVFCPSYYHTADTNYNGKTYMKYINDGHDQKLTNGLDDKVEMMWTGGHVMSNVTTANNARLKTWSGFDPLVWWNYPVTDYVPRYILLGPNPGLRKDVTNMTGVVGNPMQQGFASEISLFGLADYTWNVNDYDTNKAWEASFKHLFPEVAESLYLIAQNATLGYEANANNIDQNVESVYLKPYLDAFKNAVTLGEADAIIVAGTELRAEFDKLIDAANDVRENCLTKGLVEDLNPWLDKLESLCIVGNAVITSYTTAEDKELWSAYSLINSEINKWPTFIVKQLGGGAVASEIGMKHLTPFINSMVSTLEGSLNELLLTGDKTTLGNKMITNIDGLADTSVTLSGSTYGISNINEIQMDSNRYIGIKLENTYLMENVSIEASNDAFDKIEVQYSTNGVEWNTLEGNVSETRSNGSIFEASLDSKPARYIRIINTSSKQAAFDLLSLNATKAASKPQKVEKATSNTAIYSNNTAKNLVDGKHTTPYWTGENQLDGQEVIIEYATEFKLYDYALYEATGDYIRNGSIYVSTDKVEWTKIETVGTNFSRENISGADYYVIRGYANGIDTKYVKIATESTANNWTKLHEWEVNQTVDEVTGIMNQFSIVLDGKPTSSVDGDVKTYFTTTSDEGYLNYTLTEHGIAEELVILQNAQNISGAAVKILTSKGWKEIGTLSEASNKFDLKAYSDILEIKLEWQDNGVVPQINEMFTVTKPVDKTSLNLAMEIAEISLEELEAGSKDHSMLENAITFAKGVVADSLATRGAVADTVEGVYTAISDVVVAGKKVLKKTIDYAEKLVADGKLEGVLGSVGREFNAALSTAKTVFANTTATKTEVMEATLALTSAIRKVNWKQGDKADLEYAIEIAEIIEVDLDKYVDNDSKIEFINTLAEAREIMTNDDMLEEEITSAFDRLVDALLGLRLKIDKSLLKKNLARAMATDYSLYTEETVSELKEQIAYSAKILDNENIYDQEVVDDANLALEKKMNNLELITTTTTKSDDNDKTPAIDKTPAVDKTPDIDKTVKANKKDIVKTVTAPKTGENNAVIILSILIVLLASIALVVIKKRKTN